MPATTPRGAKRMGPSSASGRGQQSHSKTKPQDGLLLLSAKKSGGLLAAKKPSATTTTANPSKPSVNLASTPGKRTSTHQVLQAAVVGAAAASSEPTLPPDAWGLKTEKKGTTPAAPTTDSTKEVSAQVPPSPPPPPPPPSANHNESAPPGWDEYGGRGGNSRANPQGRTLVDVDEPRHRPPERPGNRQLWNPHGSEETNSRHEDASSSPAALNHGEMSPSTDSSKIHLTSYEDRDRGETTPSTDAPRMLFDPKSGAMVAVHKPAASRSEKGPRKPRHKKTASGDNTKKNPRKLKGRKDSISSENSKDNATAAPTLSSKPDATTRTRLPRTCGVLYRRVKNNSAAAQGNNNNSNCNSSYTYEPADGCPGDLGYGCHSVPGGRVLNAEAYQLFVAEHANIFAQDAALYDEAGGGADGEYTVHQDGIDDGLRTAGSTKLDTGFYLASPQPVVDWVKADDKLELVTGEEDSPTLKPTAKEWAPSQAALAAAAAAKAVHARHLTHEPSAEDSEDGAEEIDMDVYDDEDDGDGHIGLGFDPLQDMDFMSSPTQLSQNEPNLAAVNLQALALEPSAFVPDDSGGPTNSNLFAFGSSPWGTTGTGTTSTTTGNHVPNASRVLGWSNSGVGGESDVGTLFRGDVFPPNAETVSSWGATIPGLNLTNPESSATDG